jgi:RNA polymerase sigma-70 factor, ECF subfamily
MTTARGPEWDLVQAAQRGDREAFGQLYARHVGPVTRFVASRVHNQALAQDLTSETFLRALRRIDSVQDQGRYVGAWFTTIARNLIADHVRSSRYRLERPTADITEVPTQGEGPEQAVIRGDTAARLHRCVDRLPRDQQECVRLRFLQDLSVTETAARMGRSEAAVKALTHRGIQALRATMAPATGPVPPVRERTPDPLLRARHAVEQVGQCRSARQRQAVEEGRARELARRHTDHDRDSEERHAERDSTADALSTGGTT